MPAEGCFEWKHNDNQTYLVTIETIFDDLWEADEIFYVKLLNVEGASLDSLNSQATITIQQNNCMQYLFLHSSVILKQFFIKYWFSKCTIHCIDCSAMFRIQKESPDKSNHRKTILCSI